MSKSRNSGQWSVASGQAKQGASASRGSNLVGVGDRGLGFGERNAQAGFSSSSPIPNPQPPTPGPLSLVPNPQRPTPNPRSAASRRGVLLLVVLSLLTLFTLIGVTFVLVASQSRRATRADSRHEQHGDDPQRVLDSVFGQIVRDTTNTRSSLQGHSLLADMYGPSPIAGTVTATATVVPSTGGQFITFNVTADTFSPQTVQVPSGIRVWTMSPNAGHYNGCVLTIDYAAPNTPDVSMRIIGYTPGVAGGSGAITTGTFITMAEESAPLPANGDRFVVNGRPFTGSGFGYNGGEPYQDANNNGVHDPLELFTDINGNGTWDGASGLLNLQDSNSRAFALQPRQNNLVYLRGFDGAAGTLDDAVFSPNEDYDAPDAQNMLVGYVPVSPSPPPLAPGVNTIIPSLHRPQMIDVWRSHATWATDANFPRQVILRPIGNFPVNGVPIPAAAVDHPNFTGSNPNFDAVLGPWDVDNDGDGIADSVWVDIGLPVQTAPDGRRFKPLAAILCIDLDGRLNVNAHGSLAKFATVTTNGPFAGTAANSSPPLPSGEGYGPADIDLSVLFAGVAPYQALLMGTSGGTLVGRYGEVPGTAMPGLDAVDEPLSFVKQFEFPRTVTTIRTSYSTPPDLWARSVLGLDYRGQPLRYGVGAAYPNDSTDDPYEMNLSRRVIRSVHLSTGADYPFTATELERSLRTFDIDAQVLPSRLQNFLTTALPIASRAVTTDSFDLPVPSFRPTRDMVLGPDGNPDGAASTDGIGSVLGVSPTNLGIVDLLKYRLVQGGVASGAVNGLANQLLSPELIAGLKIDINRPFGNGRDDNASGTAGYNIVDDPDEALLGTGEPLWTDGNYPTGFNGLPFRHNNWEIDINGSGATDVADNIYDRQLLARHLFIMAMLLKDKNMQIPIDGKGPTPAAETARAIAQWAVNVVDFRDTDAIMTPFEYPIDPFTSSGWNVDSDPKTNEGVTRGLVWGCERPELLITETFAFHDRRTEDLATDDSGIGAHTVGSGMPPDTTFDQRLVPRDVLFVELYNPWTAVEALPAEFYYNTVSNSWSTGVLLNKLTPASAGTQAPVWRLVVVTGVRKQNDLNDPIVTDRPTGAELDRSIYFTSAAPTISTDTSQFYTSFNVAPIPPGSYAVIGPNEPGSAGPLHHIVVGRNTTDSNAAPYSTASPGTRRIDLDPTNGIVVTYDNAGTVEPTAGDTKPAVAIVIDSPRGVNVSDPTGGYPATNSTAGVEPSYLQPKDTPFDNAVPELNTTGTTPAYKTLHLQRLANPLKPWNPEAGDAGNIPALDVNPYITIDTMPIDLTSFNGVTSTSDPKDANSAKANVMFATRSRGEQNDPTFANLWRQEPFVKVNTTSPAGPVTNYFPILLQHTLGFMNNALGARFNSGNLPSGNASYLGDPQNLPFPWLTWNNRPFTSPGELLLVPRTRPSQINTAYTQISAAAVDPYTNIGAPYGHLVNFFHTSNLPGTASQMHRILDYVQVPSRFVGTETVLNPGVTYFGNPGFSASPPGYHPPFNKVSNYRDPGRVNINTIPGDGGTIWQGILNGRALPTWANVELSRRGPAGAPDAFANPFRSADGVTAVPPSAFSTLLRDTDVTFLRGATNSPWTATASLFADINPGYYNESSRNPYFHYQSLQRLSNLLTTRSNVYAVWITVGHFEVTPNQGTGVIDAGHPDGFQLGQEIGSETGEIKRPRGFYIFDRSIPVGFEPGKDHNIDQGTLIKRFIE